MQSPIISSFKFVILLILPSAQATTPDPIFLLGSLKNKSKNKKIKKKINEKINNIINNMLNCIKTKDKTKKIIDRKMKK